MTSFECSDKARPFIKWAGGKQKLAKKIVENFPINIRTYFEPFIGGGSVLFEKRPTSSVIGDQNEWLLETYEALKADPKKIMSILEKIPNNKDRFLEIRAKNKSRLSTFTRAAYFIYLNKTCFRGLFRVNRKGQFNVPYGNYNRQYFNEEEIIETSNFLQNVKIRRGDFELTMYDIEKGDFIYLDPPYYKLGGYSDFNRYTKETFSQYDQLRLASFCNELDNRNIRFLQSNSDTPFIRKIYKKFRINVIKNRREINLRSINRSVNELFISNY